MQDGSIVTAAHSEPRVYRMTVEGRAVPAVRMTRRGVQVKEHPKRAAMDRYAAWKETVGRTAQQCGITEPLTGRLWCHLWVYLRRRGAADADNLAKGIWDGLAGLAFDNDNQFDVLFVNIYAGDDDERVYIAIGRLP